MKSYKILNKNIAGVLPLLVMSIGTANAGVPAKSKVPNILFIMSDDHTSQAISAYGGILAKVLPTPNIDRIANEGAILRNCFVTNSISTPSRASIITGQYSQKNGIYCLDEDFDVNHPNVAKDLQKAGYQTAVIGKWHLGTEPTGFEYYNVLPGQGRYNNPMLIEKGTWQNVHHGGKGKEYQGHESDVIASQSIKFMENRDRSKPFFLMCHFKSPHRPWQPAERFKDLLKDVVIPEPLNLLDTYQGKGGYAQLLGSKIENLNAKDLKGPIPNGLTRDEQRHWAYQFYIKDYLRCIAGVDENVGRLLKYLDDNDLTENTVVIYTGDQGFFLGEHGWFDKRLMYEESLRMPFVIRYPKEIKPGTVNNDIILNIDFAPTFLSFAGVKKPSYMQGESFRKNLIQKTPSNWRKEMYYRYWMNGDESTTANYGIRTDRYKLVFYYGLPLGKYRTRDLKVTPEWEFYDLKTDPAEMKNLYNDPAYEATITKLKKDLLKLKKQYGDEDSDYPEMKPVIDKYFR